MRKIRGILPTFGARRVEELPSSAKTTEDNSNPPSGSEKPKPNETTMEPTLDLSLPSEEEQPSQENSGSSSQSMDSLNFYEGKDTYDSSKDYAGYKPDAEKEVVHVGD